jgi:putative ABC transport system permease protein
MGLLLRWSWRDLRSHWVNVLAIAVVIGIGTGGYAGLTSTTEWRRVSYDRSYELLAMYDVRVALPPGTTTDAGALRSAVLSIPSADRISATAERLIVPTQVDASTDTQTVLIRGEIIGADVSQGPAVAGYHALRGRLLTPDDAGEPVAMLERSFARFYGLEETGAILVSGGRRLDYVGHATSPEFFTVAPEGEVSGTEATFAAVFTTLETAQAIAGAPGRVNNLVLALTADADHEAATVEIEAALERRGVSAAVTTREDNLSYNALTKDIDQDQAMFNVLAVLLIAGAVVAAFNLIQRLIEQQRRELGIGMALGERPRLLAVRPMLVSAQVALLGVLSGIVVGVVVGNAMGAVFRDLIPLPYWDTSFQPGVFVVAALIGFIVPFVATSIPVVGAVRMMPIDAIRPLHVTAGKALRSPDRERDHNTFRVLPFRNLLRARRRSVLTLFGIAAAVTVLVGFLGIMDSVFDAIDTAEREMVGAAPQRMTVDLDGFYPVAGFEAGAIASEASVERAEPRVVVPASVSAGGQSIDVIVELADLRAGMWAPTLTAGELSDGPGLVLAEKAASDLGVTTGDIVTLRHPRREGVAGLGYVTSDVRVIATHPNPVRAIAYMDGPESLPLFNLVGLANGLNVLPAAGVTEADVQRELFGFDFVASVQPVTAVTEAVRDAFGQVVGIIQVMVVAVLILTALIAFNTAAINFDARARELATMFAFGVKVRTALGMATTESFVIGVTATAAGILGGLAMVWWTTQRLLAETLPEYALEVVAAGRTLGAVALVSILAVTIAPIFTVRRMQHMDLPSRLRLVE